MYLYVLCILMVDIFNGGHCHGVYIYRRTMFVDAFYDIVNSFHIYWQAAIYLYVLCILTAEVFNGGQFNGD